MGQVVSISVHAPQDAENALRRAVALAPEQPETWIGLVRHLIGAGQHTEASKEIENAGTALPADRKDGALAQCFELAGRLADAAESHKQAVEKSSNLAAAHRAAAEFYTRVNRPVEAEALYRKAYESRFQVTEAEFNAARRGLALALARQPRPDKTAEALKLVALNLDEKGLLKDTKFADAPEESLLQAKVLGAQSSKAAREGDRRDGVALDQERSEPGRSILSARMYVQQNGNAEWAKRARSLEIARPRTSQARPLPELRGKAIYSAKRICRRRGIIAGLKSEQERKAGKAASVRSSCVPRSWNSAASA